MEKLYFRVGGIWKPKIDSASDRRDEKRRRIQRGKRNEPDPIGEEIFVTIGSRDRQPGLANAARANDREQRALRVLQQLPQRAELWLSPDEGGQFPGQIAGNWAGLPARPRIANMR